MPLPVRCLVELGSALSLLARDDCPDTPLPHVAADLLAAIPLVPGNTIRANPGPTSTCSFERASLHQDLLHRLLMSPSCSDQESNRLASTLRSQVDLGAEPALASSQGFVGVRRVLGSPCSCGILMRSDDGSVHVVQAPVQVALCICPLLDPLQDLLPDPCLLPTIKPAGDGLRSEIVTALEHFDDLVGRFTCSQCRERKWKRGEDDVYSCPCRASVFPLAKSSATPAGPA